MIYACELATPLGPMTAAAEDGVLVGLWFVGQKYYPPRAGDWPVRPDLKVFEALRTWLKDYFSGRVPEMEIALGPKGTDFQRRVWQCLVEVPYGRTRAYGQIAGDLGLAAGSARAVGSAIGRNPISLLIPCHRIVGAAGQLTGYAGGLDRKKALLGLERD